MFCSRSEPFKLGNQLLSTGGVYFQIRVGFPRGIEGGVIEKISVMWGTAELWGVLKLDDVVRLSFEMELNAVISMENRGHSGSRKCWRSLSIGFEVWIDQEMWDNSNVDMSGTTSERMESNLVMGKDSQNSSSQCSDISLTKKTKNKNL